MWASILAQTACPLFQSPPSRPSVELDPKMGDEEEEGYA